MAGFHDGEVGYDFAYDGNERTPYAMQREGGAVAYLYYDQVGSLRVVADAGGNVIKEVLYDPFGSIIEDTNPDLRIPIGFAAGDWWDVPANIGKAKEIAVEEVTKRGKGNHNNEGDAMRHAEWSRRMAEEIGPVTSWAVGVGHEVEGLFKGQPWGEAMMDIHNNAEGRSAASERRPVDQSKLQKQPKGGFQANPYDPDKYWFQK